MGLGMRSCAIRWGESDVLISGYDANADLEYYYCYVTLVAFDVRHAGDVPGAKTRLELKQSRAFVSSRLSSRSFHLSILSLLPIIS